MNSYTIQIKRSNSSSNSWEWTDTQETTSEQAAVNVSYNKWVASLSGDNIPPLENCIVSAVVIPHAESLSMQANRIQENASSDDPMQNLLQLWFNAFASACQLDPTKLQLWIGNMPAMDSNDSIWKILDNIPAEGNYFIYPQNELTSFSQDYGKVINNLIEPKEENFKNILGDYFSQWITYLEAQQDKSNVQELLVNWAPIHLPPDLAEQGIISYEQMQQGTITIAQKLWNTANQSRLGAVAYNVSIDQFQSAIKNSTSISFSVNTSTTSTGGSQNFAGGDPVLSGMGIFGEGESTALSELTDRMLSEGLSIDASFQRFLSLPGAQLSHKSNDPKIAEYIPWYNSAAFNMAYSTSNDTLWKSGPPTWEQTFGDQGNMKRITTEFICADGINISMQSKASFNSAEQSLLMAASNNGLFPFFANPDDGTWTSEISFSSTTGSITIQITRAPGNPLLLGVLADAIGDIF